MSEINVIEMLAMKWNYKFKESMTEEDHSEFKQECMVLGVSPLDVICEMEEI